MDCQLTSTRFSGEGFVTTQGTKGTAESAMATISYFPFNSVKERGGRGATHEKRKRSTEDWGRKADIGEDMRKKKTEMEG